METVIADKCHTADDGGGWEREESKYPPISSSISEEEKTNMITLGLCHPMIIMG